MNFIPKRIVSVVPSQTELLFHLGLDEEVVGITKFCVHPEKWFKSKTRVGGTKQLDIQQIIDLNPDLIIANKEENTKEDILALRRFCRVWTSDIFTLEDNFSMVESIGILTDKKTEAQTLIQSTKAAFAKLKLTAQMTALYLIWQKPFMAVGQKSYIHDMLKYAGFKNIIASTTLDQRYPELSNNEILKLAPDYILLSSEPFPFKELHLTEIEQQFPNSKVILVDGEMFSWYGSRPLLAAEYFKSLHLHTSKI